MTGLGAPKIVGYMQQNASAVDANELTEIHAGNNNDQGALADKRRSWMRVHSHFALMGGYVFVTKTTTTTEQVHGATLTPIALRKLAEGAPELLPNIGQSDIEDKSKANRFAKFLICVQACWIIVQTAGRLASGLPISLLEMNTVLHAFCCLLIYLACLEGHIETPEGGIPTPIYSSIFGICFIYERDLGPKTSGDGMQLLRKRIAAAKEYNKQKRRSEGDELTVDDAGNTRIYRGQTVHGFVLVDTAESKTEERDLYASLSVDSLERYRLVHSLRSRESLGGVTD
ncbi:hypothetical protein CC86DRAFT_381242 [Ophiobolus disseminans]|uniref:Uncharacterized protein n=1 Tax=Ophiobolus disseminans TaxID=1469910 RepID=A0A6A7A234_9PLEO|nr:hypothetical protein CC86DRAFT_381242 [Ophiobolus disseminans]